MNAYSSQAFMKQKDNTIIAYEEYLCHLSNLYDNKCDQYNQLLLTLDDIPIIDPFQFEPISEETHQFIEDVMSKRYKIQIDALHFHIQNLEI